ncbi:MAG: type II secretion system protein [Gammaproteobacteria bacterium]|nr:type II secretion system protein [Gammaproteobacteria bacterium]
MTQLKQNAGFTLVELIVVIVITAILSSVMVQFITTPIESYVDTSRRVRLTDIAETAMQRLAYDIKTALPNSIRVGCGGQCVEFLRTTTGGRYRASPSPLDADILSFNPTDPVGGDTSFSVLGPLNFSSAIVTGSGASDCANNTASCLVVYNTGLLGSNAWNLDNMATVTSVNTVIPSISFNNGGFSSGVTAFPAASSYQRFYIVDTPVKYICDTGAGILRRYTGYNVVSSESSVDTHAELLGLGNPAEHSMLADHVSNCSFDYAAGTPTRNALLTISLSIIEAGEDINLLQQLNVVNQP